MSKNSNDDLVAGLSKLVADSNNKKESNVGKQIIDTHITPDYSDKQSILVNVSDLYASPKKWNFYEPVDDNKKLELMESIEDNGILSPIVVWNVNYESVESEYTEDEIDVYDFQGNKYLILAGHNRADAFRKLYNATNDSKYLKIPAFIFKENELTIDGARGIVVDTNYVQRVLSVKEMEKSILYKYDETERNKTGKGRTRDIVATELGISSAKVSQYKKLSEMYEPLKEMVYNDKIGLNNLLKLSDKTIDTQKAIFDEYKEAITNNMLNKVKPSMKLGKIREVFDKELEGMEKSLIKTKKITVEIPEELVEDFKVMLKNWIYNNTTRKQD